VKFQARCFVRNFLRRRLLEPEMINKLAALLAVLLISCGPSDDPEETSALRSGNDANQTQQQTLALADELFDFDPTLDPTRTALENAEAVSTRARAQLPCAMVSLSGTTLTVNAATACTTPNGVTFSGSFTAAISKTGSSLTVTLTFTSVVIGSTTVDGTTTLVTSNGSTFQVTYALTKAGTAVSGTLTAVGAPGQITVDGTLVSGSNTVTMTGVLWKKGACYPSAGSISVTQGRVVTTYTFSSSTPSTGTVTTGRGRTAQLPAYGSCPKGSDAGP
jgi:hypothetical protein